MFGEETIILNQKISLDSKNRIVLPKSTGIVSGEEIGIMFDPKKTKLLLYGLEDYYELLKKYDEYFTKLKETDEITARKYRDLKRYLYGSLCFSEEKADQNHRLTLPKRGISSLEINSSVFAVGNKRHLELYKDEETYHRLNKVK